MSQCSLSEGWQIFIDQIISQCYPSVGWQTIHQGNKSKILFFVFYQPANFGSITQELHCLQKWQTTP